MMTTTRQSRLLAAAVFSLFLCLDARAQDKPVPRLITVTGEAEVLVVPDQVVFDVTVQTFNKELRLAKAQTDERLKRLVELTRKYGVAPEDTQTDYIAVTPRYKGNDEARLLLGFTVRKDLVFTVRDVSKAEAVLSDVLETGVTRINDIDFRTSQMRKHRDQARALAMRAAREKAVALTGEIGQKVGKAHSIEEASTPQNFSGANLSSNATMRVESSESSDNSGTLIPGQIKVSARVVVRFEIE